jgi:hypothetical protein
MAAARPDQAPDLGERILELRRSRSPGRYFGVGLGTDTGGFNALPAAPKTPLAYPFRPYRGHVVFGRQQTGTRVFDLNKDGVAHYGLLPDLLASAQTEPHGRAALGLLFNSAEAYLETWSRAVATL